MAATLGEVRGSYDTDDSRHHLHSGLDVFGAYGDTVRAVRAEKVAAPLANWGFGSLNEGMRVGVLSYIHMHVGRDKDANAFDDPRFVTLSGDDGKAARVRVRRGTRFRTGDALGTVNRMYHVHMNVGPPGAQVNPLAFAPVGFTDRVAPRIEREGIQLFDESGARLDEKRDGRLVVRGRVRIVVEAHDRADMNPERRRLGLYRLGYQVLTPDLAPAPGFERAARQHRVQPPPARTGGDQDRLRRRERHHRLRQRRDALPLRSDQHRPRRSRRARPLGRERAAPRRLRPPRHRRRLQRQRGHRRPRRVDNHRRRLRWRK